MGGLVNGTNQELTIWETVLGALIIELHCGPTVVLFRIEHVYLSLPATPRYTPSHQLDLGIRSIMKGSVLLSAASAVAVANAQQGAYGQCKDP